MTMTYRVLAGTLLAALAVLAGAPATAQEGQAGTSRSGEAVYREICSACHEGGVAHAPKFGERSAWAPIVEEGQHVVTAEAWVGVRAMPPRAGQDDLTLAEFSRGVAHMARNAGADWPDPDARMLARIKREVRKHIDERIADLQRMKRDLAATR